MKKSSFGARRLALIALLLVALAVPVGLYGVGANATPAPQFQRVRPVKKIDPNTSAIPYSGLANATPEAVETQLGAKSSEELLKIGTDLKDERLFRDSLVVAKRLIDSDETPGPIFIQAFDLLADDRVLAREFDELAADIENVLQKRPDDWRLKVAAARRVRALPNGGFLVDGVFQYDQANAAEWRSAERRQRVRATQLLLQAREGLRKERALSQEERDQIDKAYAGGNYWTANAVDEVYANLTSAIKGDFVGGYWRLQTLTNFDELPDYEESDQVYRANRNSGAPVDADGNPIFFATPESFETAKNDGERVQALYAEQFEIVDNPRKANLLVARANEAQSLFGVVTLSRYNAIDDPNERSQDGVWSLHTLADDETIAKLAIGVKRFKLPKEYDYMGLWREALEYSPSRYNIHTQIAREYESRRQLDRAADAWRQAIDDFKNSVKNVNKNNPTLRMMEQALSQIVDPRVMFDLAGSKVSGMDASILLKYRNATQVDYVVRELNVDVALKQLQDKNFWTERHYRTMQERVLSLIEAERLATRVDAEEYAERIKNLRPADRPIIGDEVARFSQTLEPDPDHFDREASFEAPKLEPGAYLVEATAKDGNADVVVIWLRDRAVVRKPVPEGYKYYALDAESGAPIKDLPVELTIVDYRSFFNREFARVKRVAKKTDEDGAVLLKNNEIPEDSRLNVLAVLPSKTKDAKKQFAFLEFSGVHRLDFYKDQFGGARSYFVSDRPIYRPKQRAEFKFWLGDPRYEKDGFDSFFGVKTVCYCVTSPSGEVVASKENVSLDEYGSFADSYEIPEDAKLGVYFVEVGSSLNADKRINGAYYGTGSFRLEEYRKPEFKVVVDAPKDPVALGDSFKATVRANYYFGAPVTKATVSYTVTRTTYQSKYYPARYWDWFYGPGYWRFHYDCEWYPGFKRWGCLCLVPPYSPYYRAGGVPEVVAEGEAELDENGEFEIPIDSSTAKLIYPNDDQQYQITAIVTDASRRAIVGNGSVYAARKPFETLVWFDRGYYRQGDRMNASFQARRVDGKPVQGQAVVKLYRVAYEKTDDDSVRPVETEVFAQELKTDVSGRGNVEMTADKPGQYRVSCVVETSEGIAEEGAQLIMIAGATPKKTDASQARGDYRFNALEIIPEKPEYAVGDVARVQISSNRANALVLVTTRSENGLSDDQPKWIQLNDGVAYVDVEIERKDQPNFFIEAATFFEGNFYSELKEIVVPPEQRVLDVAVLPVKERVKPGEKTKVQLRLTDPNGNPVVGQTVATIYDESLDALAGGGGFGDIREIFWKWRRSTRLDYLTSSEAVSLLNVFNQYFASVDDDAWQKRLQPIGIFNGSITTLGATNDAPMGAMTLGAKPMSAMARGGGMGGARREMKALARNQAFDDVVEEEAMETAEADFALDKVAAAPAPAMAPMAKEESFDLANAQSASDAAGDAETFVEATVRKNLADLAFWAADLKPSDDGVIEIEVDMPENLTTWKIAAWSVGEGLRVGSGESEIITSKDLIVRMQKPRFLTRGDEVVLSANVHNYLDSEKKIQVSLEFPTNEEEPNVGLTFAPGVEATQTVVAPSNGEARVDWLMKVDKVGDVTMIMKALTNEESDAIQDKISVKEHGIDKQLAVSGVVAPNEKADVDAKSDDAEKVREETFTLVVPEERRADTTRMTVRFSPSLAGAILDALPYMMEYPYGCTEQTLNKFMPLAIAHKTLIDAGIDLATLRDKRVNLNAQELGDAQERAKQWSKRYRRIDPIFDEAETRRRVAEGVAKLQSMRNDDGGWGWFYGSGSHSSPRLTSLVTRGLYLAQQSDFQVDESIIDGGRAWLLNYEREEVVKLIRGRVWSDEKKSERESWGKWKDKASSEDAYVFFTLMELGIQPGAYDESFVDYENATLVNDGGALAVMKEFIWESRDSLELYPLAAYALALTFELNPNEATRARIDAVLRMLAQYRKVDDENQTVWLDLNRYAGWRFWSWYGNEFETQAYYLRLLNRADRETLEKAGLADDAPRLVKYLLNNRKNATYWNSTRDTAACVEAFAEYLRKTSELSPNMTVEVYVGDELKKTVEYTPENVFLADGTVELSPDEIASGECKGTIRVKGDGALYYNAYLEFFSLEDPIEKAGLEVKVERRYFKLVEKKDATALVEGGSGQAISQRVERYDRVPLASADEVVSGDLVEVELIIDSKNDYESLLMEDAKPAGYEAVDQLSGYRYKGLGAYVEFRDDRVCFFIENLPQGRSTTSYRLRAETPGKFSALPTTIYGMYAPELRGNSDEFKATVIDK